MQARRLFSLFFVFLHTCSQIDTAGLIRNEANCSLFSTKHQRVLVIKAFYEQACHYSQRCLP